MNMQWFCLPRARRLSPNKYIYLKIWVSYCCLGNIVLIGLDLPLNILTNELHSRSREPPKFPSSSLFFSSHCCFHIFNNSLILNNLGSRCSWSGEIYLLKPGILFSIFLSDHISPNLAETAKIRPKSNGYDCNIKHQLPLIRAGGQTNIISDEYLYMNV